MHNILHGRDDRLLVVVGPCSIHDPEAALDYARRLAARTLAQNWAKRCEIVMRVYFEKPRTTIGWKGLINDPHLDGTLRHRARAADGAQAAARDRKLGLPAATEFLDPITPQYIADLVAWAAIGARTTESQTHREMASGLSMPVGFKNGTDGNLGSRSTRCNRRRPAPFPRVPRQRPHRRRLDAGNDDCHVILRGGKRRPTTTPGASDAACGGSQKPACRRVMIDASHANSGKKPENQPSVAESIADQRSWPATTASSA